MRFHVALAEASGNEALHLVMLALRAVIGRYMSAMNESVRDLRRRLPAVTADHASILEAIEQRDAQRAVESTHRHLVGSHRLLKEWADRTAHREVVRLR
jgi:DNA-binding FadR family transcriptional regulator